MIDEQDFRIASMFVLMAILDEENRGISRASLVARAAVPLGDRPLFNEIIDRLVSEGTLCEVQVRGKSVLMVSPGRAGFL